MVLVAALAQHGRVALAGQRAPLQLAVAAAQQVDGPHQGGAAGGGDAVDDPLVHVPVGRRVDLEPVRLAARLGDLDVRLRALVGLHLQDVSGACRPGRTALALCVISLQARHRTQEEGRRPAAAVELHRGVDLRHRLAAEPPGTQHQALESLPVRPARLVVVDPHVEVVPVLGQVGGVRRALEVPDIDRVVRRLDELTLQLIFDRVLGRQHGVLPGAEARLHQRLQHLRAALGAARRRGAGGCAPLRLAGERALPVGRQTRRGQTQQRAGRQQLEELPPARCAVGGTRIRSLVQSSQALLAGPRRGVECARTATARGPQECSRKAAECNLPLSRPRHLQRWR